MSALGSWLTYVRIRREDGGRPFLGEVYLALLLTSLVVLAWYLSDMPNSFGKDGLVDGLGTFTSVLAGFFVAGLVAIATFFRENSSLDDVIEKGPGILNYGTDDEERLTRRQYVCSMFGFLVALSFFLAISSILLRSFSPAVAQDLIPILENLAPKLAWHKIIEVVGLFIWVLFFVWQISLTLRGLYYLMDRIYDVRLTLGRPKQ